MTLEWFIARRYLSSPDGRRLLSLIPLIAAAGIFVGVAALILVTAVMNGLQDDLRDKILGASPHISVTARPDTMEIRGWRGVLRRVRRVEGVEAAAPFVKTEVVIANGANYTSGAILRGVDAGDSARSVSGIGGKVRSGTGALGATRSGHPPLLVGSVLAERLGVVPGDLVTVISAGGRTLSSLSRFQPHPQPFEVVGAFETGVYSFDAAYLFTTVAAGQDLAGFGEAVSGIAVRTRDPMRADRVAREIERALGPGYRAQEWQAANASLFSALKLEKLAMGIILLLIVLVASFGIVSLLVMLVNEKRREIGILRSMGLRAAQVRRVFMLQGVVIGVLGSALGGATGLLLSWILGRYPIVALSSDAFDLDRLPVAFDRLDIALILAASLVISFLATIYPARRAAGLSPVEAIREG
jgi:lipoprotein-releasing system permease protein